MLAEKLPRRLPRAPVSRDWRRDAQFGAQINPVPPFKAPLVKSPEALLGSPIGGLIVRADWMLGAATRTFTDVLDARLVEKPGTLIDATAMGVDQHIELTKARIAALQARAQSGKAQLAEARRTITPRGR